MLIKSCSTKNIKEQEFNLSYSDIQKEEGLYQNIGGCTLLVLRNLGTNCCVLYVSNENDSGNRYIHPADTYWQGHKFKKSNKQIYVTIL